MTYRIVLIFILTGFYSLKSQEQKIIEIRQAGGSKQDQDAFPGANILFKNSDKRVILFHDGALIESDLAYFYAKENFFKAIGDVVFTQGDSLKMTCNKIDPMALKKFSLA
jgi:hypothetical protein